MTVPSPTSPVGSDETAATHEDSLAPWIHRYQLPVPPEAIGRLEGFCRALWAWNEKINLTRHSSFERFASRDLPDVSQLAELLAQGERVLDVGSGGGLPGVPLALVRPDLRVSLCESVGKKARATTDIVSSLGLNIPVYPQRAEEVLQTLRFDSLVVRAVASLEKLLGWFQPHWASCGRLLLVKGRSWIDERAAARHRGLLKNLEFRKAAEYVRPGDDHPSVILSISPK